MQESMLVIARRQGSAQPDAVAFVTPAHRWTFGAIERLSNQLAQGFAHLGIGRGDRVAGLTKHTAECVAVVLAAQKVGAVCMPVNWRLAPPEVEYIVNDGEAKFLMVDAAFAATASAASMPALRLTVATEGAVDGLPGLTDWARGFEVRDPGYQPSAEDTALQLYSSGTTGRPKGVELTHRNFHAAFSNEVPRAIGYGGAPDVMLNALPTFHIAGIGIGLMTYIWGGKSVLFPDFNPPHVLEAFGPHRITHSFLVPAMIQVLVQTPGASRHDFTGLRSISYGASPISDRVLVDAMRTFRCGFVQVYGLTETTGAITALPAEDHDPDGPKAHLLRSAGKAIGGVELRIADPATGGAVPDGQVGEVWIRSRQNMKGYWRNPTATADVFVDRQPDGLGWFRSGDAGYLRDGYLFLHDRIKDMIISGGENIYPAEVENVLMKHPAIADGAVIGVPDEQWGEAVKACVVLKPGAQASAAELIAFMRERIAHYKCPKSVDVVDTIPRNPSGKVLKRILREPYWQGQERRVH
jgi:acyl-CoA synthetase (AMP-forming)/AMP-acid ligase II